MGLDPSASLEDLFFPLGTLCALPLDLFELEKISSSMLSLRSMKYFKWFLSTLV
jgi:hypothetical protein